MSFISISLPQNNNVDKTQSLSYGFYLLENNETKEAEKVFQEHIKSLNSLKEKKESYYQISRHYNISLFFDLSILYATEGLKIKSPKNYLTKDFYQVISNNHLDLKNFDLAEEYYLKSIENLIEGEVLLGKDYNLMGEILRLSGKYENSLNYFHMAIEHSNQEKSEAPLATFYNNIGLSHLELNNLDSSEFYLKASKNIISKLNITNAQSAINISFGELSLKRNSPQEALLHYQKTITYDLSSHPDQYEVYRDAYNGMWRSYELLNLNKEALNAYKNFHKYQSKILDYSKQTIIFQNQILNERNIHKKQLEVLKTQIELEQKYNKAILILSGVILLIVILLIYALWLRNKSIKQKVELIENKNLIQELEIERVNLSNDRLKAENLQNKQEQQIKDLEKEKLKEEIDFKNRELTSTAIHLLNKNEILNEIGDKVSDIVNTPPSELSSAIKRINYLIKDNLQLDNDWEVFKKHFTDVHPEFFNILLNKYPELTPDELKLCAYLKIQLSSKEIARLINITAIAVNKRRNRMRKKLDIAPDVDLHEFILNITSKTDKK